MRRTPKTRPGRLRAVGLATVVVTALAGCAARTGRPGDTSTEMGLRATTPTALTTPSTPTTAAPPTLTYSIGQSTIPPRTSPTLTSPTRTSPTRLTGSSTPSPREVRPTTSAVADEQIGSETAYLGSGGASIEAVNLHSGVSFSYGAGGGMRTGSIAKLYILETLLLQHQNAGTSMSAAQKQLATAMIEHSDNEAADDLWDIVGRAPALREVAETLGVEHTVPGPARFWGYTQTCASDYIALLRNLVAPSALNPASRA